MSSRRVTESKKVPQSAAPSKQPDKRFSEDNMVTLLAGEQGDRFRVDVSLLCNNSRFFKSLLPHYKEGDFAGADVNLTHATKECVSLMSTWLYGGGIQLRRNFSFEDVMKPYKMADKLMMLAFKNALMDRVRQRQREPNGFAGASVLGMLYDNDMDHTHLYKYMIKRFTYCWMTSTPDGDGIWTNGEKRQDEFRKLSKYPANVTAFMDEMWNFKCSPYEDPARELGCCYHDHDVGETCDAAVIW